MENVTRDDVSVATYASDGAQLIAGRSLTRSKAPGKFFEVGYGPLYANSGEGAIVHSVDGKEYIDMLCALGARSLGYEYPAGKFWLTGPTYIGVGSLPSPLEGTAAFRVREQVAPWCGAVRFVKTGSEATHAAYRIAKRVTGRTRVLMGDWAYHGWHEWCEKKADGTMELETTVLYPHGSRFVDWESQLPAALYEEDVAAVFVEPHRWEAIDPAWLLYLRAWCDKAGALLVFDEMIYGGRWAVGGATEYFGVTPDLACYGKAFGNGAAVAFVVGKAEYAEAFNLISGTYSGDDTGLAALLRTLAVYKHEPVIETLWRRGRQLQRGLRDLVTADGPIRGLEGAPVHQRFVFRDAATGLAFGAAMAKRGVLIHPACINVCYSHTAEQIEQVIDAAAASAREVAVPIGQTQRIAE